MSRTVRRKGLWYGEGYRIHTDYYNWRWRKSSHWKDYNNLHMRSQKKTEISKYMKTGEIDHIQYSFAKKKYGYNAWMYE